MVGLASLLFYGYWAPPYTALLLASIAVNYYSVAQFLNRAVWRWPVIEELLLWPCYQLGVLAYFKYANFFIDTVNVATSASIPLLNVVLPIGISFSPSLKSRIWRTCMR